MRVKLLGFLVVALLLVPFAYADGTPVNNVTNLGAAISSNNFSKTRYRGVSTSSVYSNPKVAYEEVA